MKILVTSGGTKVPIDSVRSITNMSSGTFGSKIATELLKLGHQVVFLKAKGSKTPFSINTDVFDPQMRVKMSAIVRLHKLYHKQYKEYEYATFDEYDDKLDVIWTENPDVIVLAAAVSDYGVENYVEGKIRSKDELTIHLKPLPKLIAQIKEISPKAKLVGFKLLVDSTTQELLDASFDSINKNGCDMIVANDLADIRNNEHKVHLVWAEKSCKLPQTFRSIDSKDPNYLANIVAQEISKI